MITRNPTNEQPKIILTVGISNSGKTTWAEQQVWSVDINRDKLRFVHYCQPEGKTLSQYKFSKAKENHITEVQFKIAERSLSQGNTVIISDTNLNPKTRERWFEFAKEHNVPIEIKEFDIEPHVAKARNIKREHSIPPHVIDLQYKQWRKYKNLPTYEASKELPNAVIFDVDGTLADMKNLRRPFEWDKVDLDKPRENVIHLSRLLHRAGYKIIVMSGRDGICYDDTLDWLKKYDIPFQVLFMRGKGDSRPDAVVKEEMFWKYVADYYNVHYVIDDRNQMVDRWRAMGLECWQVQEGAF